MSKEYQINEQMFSELKQYLSDNLVRGKLIPSQREFHSACPFCGDSKSDPYARSFYINIDPTSDKFLNYHCFRASCCAKGIVNEDFLSMIGTLAFISSEMLNDENASVIEKDGLIIVTTTTGAKALEIMGEDIVSCVESYTLDAKTREMIAVKTVYTYLDGTVEEGIITITRDTEAPEGAKPFIAYDEQTEDLRTVTVVSNPGADNEKTETIKAPKGLKVAFYLDFESEDSFTLYSDAACTLVIEGDLDVNSDVTVYVKWSK
jgi:hypothetical protein